MAWGSVLNIPFMIILIFPALKSENLKSTNFFLSNGFVYTVILLGSMSNGFGQGISQPSSGTYISECATERTKGFFFAFYWAFYMGSQVFGNLIAAFVLGELDQKYFVLVMAVIGISASILLFFLKPPTVQHMHDHHFHKSDDLDHSNKLANIPEDHSENEQDNNLLHIVRKSYGDVRKSQGDVRRSNRQSLPPVK